MRPRLLIRYAPILLLAVATLGFGVAQVLAKVILNRGVKPLELLPVRLVVGILSLIALLAAMGHLKSLGRDVWKKGAILGVLNMGAPMTLMTFGLEDLSASVTALLVGLLPLTTVGFAHFLIAGENMRRGLLPGFILALIGTGFLIDLGAGRGANPLLGFVLVVLGVITAGLGGALARRFAIGVPAAELILPQFVVAGCLVVLASLLTGNLSGLGQIDLASWGLIALLGAPATTLPFGALLWLSELGTAARASLVAYLVPLVGVTGGVVILGEPVGPRLLVAGALILAGVLLADRSERRNLLDLAPP